MCMKAIRVRTDLWGVTLALSDNGFASETDSETESGAAANELGIKIAELDESLKASLSTLATVAQTTAFRNFRDGIAEARAQPLPWWLGNEIDDAYRQTEQFAQDSLPSPELVVLADQARFKSGLPEYSVSFAAAPLDGQTDSPDDLRWGAGDDSGLYAKMSVPAVSSDSEERVERKLIFWRTTPDGDVRNRDLAGSTIRIGNHTAKIDESAQAIVRLSDLRDECDGLLWVGESPYPWLPSEEE